MIEYLSTLKDFEARFDEFREFWQKRLADTAGVRFWSALRDQYQSRTQLIRAGRKSQSVSPISALRPVTAPYKTEDTPTSKRSRRGNWFRIGRGEKRSSAPKKRRSDTTATTAIPDDFDPEFYLHINPDVRSSGMDAVDHYVLYGKAEGRHYK